MDSFKYCRPLRPRLQGDLYLSDRLIGQDDRLEQLFSLFEQLQLATVEACQPTLDLLTFSDRAFYFAVILKRPFTEPVVEEEQGQGSQISKGKKRKLPVPPRLQSESHEDGSVKTEAVPELAGGPSAKRHHKHAKNIPSMLEPYLQSAKTSTNRPADVFHQDILSLTTRTDWKHLVGHSSGIVQRDSRVEPLVDFESDNSSGIHDHPTQSFGGLEAFPSIFRFDDDIVEETKTNHWSMDEAIGLVYLMDLNAFAEDPLREGELNIGIALKPKYWGKGYAHQVISAVLAEAFSTGQCHRVQAILPDHIAKERAICLFTQMMFDHEGTRRRAFYSPMERVYKDVTYMGMLDTDWILRSSCGADSRPAPKTLWDELFVRHQREREELMNWQEKQAWTPRALTPIQTPPTIEEDEESLGVEEQAPAEWFIKRESTADTQLQSSELIPVGYATITNDPFATSSEYESDTGSVSVRSASPRGYLSATSSPMSAWDVVDTSESDSESSMSSSSFDSMDDALELHLDSPRAI
ncbi:hypothetical protein DXG01_007752 [Tephrocybe rancida]|nr:hypothetical protein DXG01_007752 [Tephrocybe rancida]